ncbi:ABC transporter permease [Bacillus sp. JJ1532]|uniref:ABC transporter permease n=1 Tax=Bacillus sp. JJ1532 TaxID=3122958 RepID=UPI0030001B99
MESQQVLVQSRKLLKEQHRLLFKRFLSNKLMLTGSVILFFLLAVAAIGPFIVTYSPTEMLAKERLAAPSASHWLGVDNFGRDLLARVVHGAKISMGIGIAVTLITSLVGLVIGVYASYYRILDHILMRICDGLMAIPGILLSIALMAVLGPSITNIIIALSIVFTPSIARVVRSVALVVYRENYIEAIKSQGASPTRIIWRHIVPNTISALVIQATFIFAETVIVEASLSFLGVGVPVPTPSWGSILYDGKFEIFQAWWMVVFPGAMIILAVVSLNMLGDGLRDLIDPHFQSAKKLKKGRLRKKLT